MDVFRRLVFGSILLALGFGLVMTGCGKKEEPEETTPDEVTTEGPERGSRGAGLEGLGTGASRRTKDVEGTTSRRETAKPGRSVGVESPGPMSPMVPTGELAVVANVNGVAVSMDTGMLEAMGGMESPAAQRMMEQAIEQELLYQAAVASGLDQTEEYTQVVEQIKSQAEMQEVSRLASFYEQEAFAGTAGAPAAEVSDAEVDAYYAEHERQYGRLSEDRARQVIRRTLEARKRQEGRSQWVKELAQDVPISINGVAISPDAITSGISTTLGAVPSQGGGALWSEITNVMASNGINTDNAEEVQEALSQMTIQVGDFNVPLGRGVGMGLGMPPPGLEGSTRVMPSMSEAAIASMLQPYIIASAGKAAGIENSSGWVESSRAMSATPFGGGIEASQKAMLGSMYIQKNLGPPINPSDISQAEVDAYFEENKARLDRLSRRRGKRGVDRIIRSILTSQKANDARQQAIQELKDNATIETP